MKKKVNRKRAVAKLVCILFLVSVLLSMTYIIMEADHECIGDHCPICAHIQTVERVIGELGTALAIMMHIGFSAAILCIVIFHFIVNPILYTLVTQNVRMNN